MTYDAQRALQLLRAGTGDPHAVFRTHQEEAIRFLVEGGRHPRKLLLVQKTGWGKSFVYFIAAKLLRQRGSGPVLLISPLLALMRNQIEMTKRLGVRADTLNSDNFSDWDSVIERLARNEIDVLLVSPERLANKKFLDEAYPHFSRPGMWVVDEAHCISDWGHDFRPDYRRIESLMQALPANVPMLAVTATANDRVIEDVKQTLGPGLEVVRGDLHRPSLLLQTIAMPNPRERLAWLAERLPQMPGSGIIYTLTVRDAEQVARWLQSRGLDVRAYTGSTDSEERPQLENALLDNRVKALAATSALGMGFDKPDLGFVIHYQAPASAIAYYQQVGRAGRGAGGAYGVLLSGAEDKDITDFFRESAFPSREEVKEVLDALGESERGLGLSELQDAVNIRGGRLQQTLKLLQLETPAPLAKQGNLFQLTPQRLGERFWERVGRLNRIRLEEQAQMREYVQLAKGHMEFLVEALDGPRTATGSSHNLHPLPVTVSGEMRTAAEDFLSRYWYVIEPRKKWPGGGLPKYEVHGSIGRENQHQPGKALCQWGNGKLGHLVEDGKYKDGSFSDRLVEACVKLLDDWNPAPAPKWVACVPSRNHPDLVPDFARRLAAALGIPFRMVLEDTGRNRPQQKGMRNSQWQARNVDGAFRARPADILPREPVLLVDDMVDSSWTMTVCAWLLRTNGAGQVWPLALAKAGNS